RNNEEYNVVAFTAAQIPDIDGRKYPKELAGELYPEGIPIFKEEELETLIKKYDVDECVFAYSDVHYTKVMRIGFRVNSDGENFKILGNTDTQLKSINPVVSVCGTRTGT